ncbi:MAG TPA: hypothetical protein VFE58_04940 [Tepidisphaeraceae bacterium]|jgi:hypothetical protein|nr:hypothetical protein [Tepidisphaeraceae bacterium]
MKLRHLALLAAVGLAAAGVQSASADSIAYSTGGAFTANTSGGVIAVDSITFGSAGNTTTLTFVPTAQALDTPVTGLLGAFTITNTGTGATAGDGTADFELTITQSVPGAGIGTSGGGVVDHFGGKITSTTGGYFITLVPTSLDILNVHYKIDNLQGTNNNQLAVGGANTSVNADITTVAVPLPAAAWGGMGLMGVLGGVQALRRRSMSR